MEDNKHPRTADYDDEDNLPDPKICCLEPTAGTGSEEVAYSDPGALSLPGLTEHPVTCSAPTLGSVVSASISDRTKSTSAQIQPSLESQPLSLQHAEAPQDFKADPSLQIIIEDASTDHGNEASMSTVEPSENRNFENECLAKEDGLEYFKGVVGSDQDVFSSAKTSSEIGAGKERKREVSESFKTPPSNPTAKADYSVLSTSAPVLPPTSVPSNVPKHFDKGNNTEVSVEGDMRCASSS